MTTINAKPNKDGRVIVRLFRNDYDVTDRLIDGIATISLYGETYEVHAKTATKKAEPAKKPAKKGKKIAVKKKKDNGAKVDVEFIETPEEA